MEIERRLHGVPVWCSVLYSMHHEYKAPPPLPFNVIYGSLLSRPRRLPVRCSVLYNMHHEGSSPGPGEDPSWHLFLLSVMFDKA